jgi:hypothetical protein
LAADDSVRAVSGIERSPGERLAAWVVTGPPGHLYGTLADVVVLWVRYGRHRAKLALRGGPTGCG